MGEVVPTKKNASQPKRLTHILFTPVGTAGFEPATP
jgi:hypothetical protein